MLNRTGYESLKFRENEPGKQAGNKNENGENACITPGSGTPLFHVRLKKECTHLVAAQRDFVEDVDIVAVSLVSALFRVFRQNRIGLTGPEVLCEYFTVGRIQS